MKKIYVDEYQVGAEISEREHASVEYWPVSHGPYDTVEAAEKFKKKLLNLKAHELKERR